MTGAERRPPLWTLMLVLILVEIVGSFQSSMIFAALPTISREFADPAQTGWLVTSYILVQAVMAALGGRLGDLYGRKIVLIILLLTSAFGSTISAFAPSLELMILGRAIQGVSGAVLPLCFGLAREHAPRERIAWCISIISATAAAGSAAGMVLSGAITQHAHWSLIFHVTMYLPLFAIAAMAVLPRSAASASNRSIDYVGGILFAPAIAIILLAITLAPGWGWLAGRTLMTLLAGLVLFAIWIGHEARHPDPLINVRLLGRRQIAMANLLSAVLSLGSLQILLFMMALAQQPLWTGVGLGLTATAAALVKLPSNIVSVLIAPITGRLADRHGGRVPAICGSVLLIAGWSGMALLHHHLPFVVLTSVVIGAGVAMTMAAQPILAVEVSPEDRTSEVTGLISVVRFVFMAIGAQIVAFLLGTSVISAPGLGSYPAPEAFTGVFIFMVATAIACLVAALLLPARPAR